MSVIIKLLDIA